VWGTVEEAERKLPLSKPSGALCRFFHLCLCFLFLLRSPSLEANYTELLLDSQGMILDCRIHFLLLEVNPRCLSMGVGRG
jgi:hypothetical protein